jgi:hypothetical protein
LPFLFAKPLRQVSYPSSPMIVGLPPHISGIRCHIPL